MTVLVGVKCVDGIVIGADSFATSSMGVSPLLQVQSNDKITLLQDSVIVAATGSVGYSQRLTSHVEAAMRGGQFANSRGDCATNITRRFLTDLEASKAQAHPHHGIGFAALIAGAIKNEACLIEYGSTDFQPEFKERRLFFVSLGSGQQLAEPFLAFVSRVLWQDKMPTVDEAKFGVYWVLDHTIKLAPGGVGGDRKIATLRQVDGRWKAEQLADTGEASQYIVELEKHIAAFARQSVEDAPSQPLPQAPSP